MTTILTEIGWENEDGIALGTWTTRHDLVNQANEIAVAPDVTVNSLAGNDIIIGTSTEETVLPVPLGFGIPVIGIYNRGGSIDVDHGNDFISGTGNGIENSVGILNIEGSIEGSNGEDSIFGIGTGNGGFGIYNGDSNIDGGNGEDFIFGIGTDNGSLTGRGVVNVRSTMNGGNGSDSIIGIGTKSTVNNEGDGYGIENSEGTIDGGRGNDTISGIGNVSSDGVAIGINNNSGSINGGNGNDSISGVATGIGIGGRRGDVIGIVNDDIINGGNGNDSISGTATSNSSDSVTVGILNQGRINTGNGNDTVDALTGGFAAIDALGEIDLGVGRDLIKGFGEQIVDGGRGFDTSELGIDFDENQITFGSTAPTSIDITFDSATMSFTDVESFDFNGQVFALEQLQDMV